MPRPSRALDPLAADGDPVTLSGPAVGLVAIDLSLSTAALAVTGGVAWSGAIATQTLTVDGTLILSGLATLTADSASLIGGIVAQGGGATLAVSGGIVVSGMLAALAGGSVLAAEATLSGGTLTVDAASALAFGAAPDAGAIVVGADATLSGAGALQAPVENHGVILASGGALSLGGPVSGDGTLAIGDSGTLFAPDAVGPGVQVVFVGAGTLDLFSPTQGFAAPIAGFGPSDVIDIATALVTQAVWQSGTLTLALAQGGSFALALSGAYDGQSFVALPDGLGGSDIRLPAATASGLIGTDVTLGAGGGLVLLNGGVSADTLTSAGAVAMLGTAQVGTLGLGGTVAVMPGGWLRAAALAGNGLLAIEGSGALSMGAVTGVGGTIDLLVGGSATLDSLALAGGALLVDAQSAMSLGGGAARPGSIVVGAADALSGFGRIAAPLWLMGGATARGGQLSLAAPVAGSGSLAIASGATLALYAPVTVPVVFSAGATMVVAGVSLDAPLLGFGTGDVLDLAVGADTAVWRDGTLTLSLADRTVATLAMPGDLAGQDWLVGADGAGGTLLRLAAGVPQPLDVTGTLTLSAALSAPSATVAPGAMLALAGGTLTAGALTVGAGGTVAGYGALVGPLALTGLLASSGGVLAVGHVTGSGTALIGAGAVLYASGGIDAGVSVVFTGAAGTLELFANALATGATITGLGASPGQPFGNLIDIAAATVTSASYSDLDGGLGALALTGPSGDLGTLTLAGVSGAPGTLLRPDGVGGTLIQLVPCFAAGTRIATPQGDRPVELLRPGDAVLTPRGPRPLCWTGMRRACGAATPEARPVRIGAGALGPGLPSRDLVVSPRHALRLGQVLVPAVALLDGRSVRREPAGAVTYHHLGLARHDVVRAEQLWAETWRPVAGAEFERESGKRPEAGPPCAPMVEAGAPLAALRRHWSVGAEATPPAPGELRGHVERIDTEATRTRVTGWAQDSAAPANPVRLLALDPAGSVLGGTLANLWRPDLDRAGLGNGDCGFVLDLPGHAGPVRLVRADDRAELPIDHAAQPGGG